MPTRFSTPPGEQAGVHLITSPLLHFGWLAHGFSTRPGGVTTSYLPDGRTSGGELNLGHTPEDTDANVAENERRLLSALAPGRSLELVRIHQVHSATVWRDPKRGVSGDALFTTLRDRVLTVRVADCVPILIADVNRRAVAAVHAGWRGTVERIVEKTVGELRAQLGSDPADLRAVIGPSIRGCCYEVGPEVVESFEARFRYASELFSPPGEQEMKQRFPNLFLTGAPPGHPHHPRWNPEGRARVDLAEANRRQLLDAGLAVEHIDVLPYCTSCRADLFFSHRRDAGRTGRMAAAIVLL